MTGGRGYCTTLMLVNSVFGLYNRENVCGRRLLYVIHFQWLIELTFVAVRMVTSNCSGRNHHFYLYLSLLIAFDENSI